MTVTRRLMAVGVVVLGTSLWAATLSPAISGDSPRVGSTAPAFDVQDVTGNRVTLSALKGKTVVLEWTNPECPYVEKHYSSGNMQALQREAIAAGTVWLTITSAGQGNVGYLDALEAAALNDERKSAPSAFLLDHNGRMMSDYAVPVALTMAVIAPDGRLAYYGAIDDKPTSKVEDVPGAKNYVRAALAAVAKGETPKPAQTRPYGCVAR
jgi:hypothetical protein